MTRKSRRPPRREPAACIANDRFSLAPARPLVPSQKSLEEKIATLESRALGNYDARHVEDGEIRAWGRYQMRNSGLGRRWAEANNWRTAEATLPKLVYTRNGSNDDGTFKWRKVVNPAEILGMFEAAEKYMSNMQDVEF